jgi:hypothetical protein
MGSGTKIYMTSFRFDSNIQNTFIIEDTQTEMRQHKRTLEKQANNTSLVKKCTLLL